MTEGGGNALLTSIVEGYDTAVGEWQLDLALALLTSNLTRHGAVHLIGEPVFTGDGLELEDSF